MEKGEHLKRQNRPTMLQLQYLQRLSRVEKKRGAQGSIAESYGVNRSTVNRYFKNCIERGILTESLEFTAAGEEWLERYTKLYENLEKYLEENGFEIIEARMTDVIRKTYFYQDSQIREYHLNKPMDQKIWFRTADMFFDLAHSLTDSIAKGHPLYKPAIRMDDLVKDSDPIIHHTFDAGEGVLIPGEIIHHAKHGCKYFLILQPFGCLPNHVVGRGISKKLKEMYPNAQILPLDYDPDVSFANIENRLQMLVMNAKQEILEENEERDRRRSHHYMESDKKTYRRKKYGVEKTSGV